MTRTDIINKLIETYDYTDYLEIGVNHTSLNFDKINCQNKTGVDPKGIAGIAKLTSDEFFKQNKKQFDLIFIDGLHEEEQVLRDIDNSLKCLTDNGTIIVHDINPTTERMQLPTFQTGEWTGTVWKAWVHLRRRSDLSMFAFAEDYGIGIIRKGTQTPLIVEYPTYEQFAQHKKEWLNIIPAENEPVSIVIPAFEQYGHGVKTLTELLKCLRTQSGSFEVIISDNSNDDKIEQLCSSYDVKYFHNPKRGVSANTNFALDKASHDIVKIMYQDDLFMTTDAIDTISFAMKFNNWVACSGIRIDEHGRPGKMTNPRYADEIMKGRNTLGMPSAIAHRKNEIRFDESLRVLLDVEFYYLLNQKYGEPGYVKKKIISPRYWHGSTSAKQGNKNFLQKEVEYLAKKHNLLSFVKQKSFR